ncbi:hypothetical protein ACTA71_000258 [Dictyostelium dimigraforme]
MKKIKFEPKDISGLVESKTCINCFRDHSVDNKNKINDNGDKVLVGVSGGKDVVPQSPDCDSSQLKNCFASLGVPYFYVGQAIMESAKSCRLKEGIENKARICAFCSRMRRSEGYNVE